MSEIIECPSGECTKQNIIEIPDNFDSVLRYDSFDSMLDKHSPSDYYTDDDKISVDCDGCGNSIFIIFSYDV